MKYIYNSIVDFSDFDIADRQGIYGGQAGSKDSIMYGGDYWIIKYPKNTQKMSGNNLSSYTTAPLSEYIGSHVYDILGLNVHDTVLGIRRGKVIVACKDFCKTRGALMEIRTIKNASLHAVSEELQEDLPSSITGDMVDLKELFIHFQYNPLLMHKEIHDRFWDMVVIDILINNNDRNNGNWGLLYDEINKSNELAPIYDNGNSFYNKMSEEQIQNKLLENDINRHLDVRTPYVIDEHILSAKKLLRLNYRGLRESLIRNVPLIKEKFLDISVMIRSIPENHGEFLICSKERKEYYLQGMEVRLNELLYPAYEHALASFNQIESKETVGEEYNV